MFTNKAQSIIDRSKDFAFSEGSPELTLRFLLAAMCDQAEAAGLLAESLHLTKERIIAACPAPRKLVSCTGKLPLSGSFRLMLTGAKELAEAVPDRSHPGLIDLKHLLCAVAVSREACAILDMTPLSYRDALNLLSSWHENDLESVGLEDLTERLRVLRTELLTKVFGQDHAVHAFIDGLFNAEVVATADSTRRSPRSLFVFAGPPGVGKTFLAELGAAALGRPFKRFDMSAYSGHQQNEQLVGMARSYHGAHPGTLTEFVEKNPNAVLLFDEIEKSHLNTIHLFLQVLDAGTLEDKYHERDVSFRDTTIIFTTNAGRRLYDKPNESGVHKSNEAFHRKTILDALENEKNPLNGEPFFPAAICSRMATGYPVLFNHLRVNELERVVQGELTRIGRLFERQYYKRVSFDELLPLCLVLREGARSDARTLRSQTEAFFKSEIFKFCQLFKAERLEQVLERIDRINFRLDGDLQALTPEVQALLEHPDQPQILLVADSDLTSLYPEFIPQIRWFTARTGEEALQVLSDHEVDLVLLDLWIGRQSDTFQMTMEQFDHVPAAARGLDRGQELLHTIHERMPGMPVYLLSLAGSEPEGESGTIDEDLFLACVRGGGARGLVESAFMDGMLKGWETQRDQFAASLTAVCRRLYREKAAAHMGQERKVLTFETAPQITEDERAVVVRLRNLRLARAIAAADAGELLDEVERPRTRFTDVIGAESAKEELSFFIDYLKNPRRFAALGLKPPKGVLLYGPPGTGKTMLARAMAGESDVAFIPVSASSFVTIWQGSGPQNVRDLFARARRYAPAIIFIDEIDAIGKVRTGGPGASQASENTLNALLTEMDGFTSPSAERPVFVLAATNFSIETENEMSPGRHSRTLDNALVRRFARSILVALPDTAARKKYLTSRLAGARNVCISEATVDLLAGKSAGLSIANLEQVLDGAARTALKKHSQLTDDLLVEAFDTFREGEAKEWTPELLESTARHEAGHTIMYWLSSWWSPEVSIIARGDHGGGMRRDEQEMKRESLTKDEMLARIRTALGGRAAEILYYGQAGLTTGVSGDLENASNMARQMICRYGMDADFGPLATPELFKYAEAISSPVYARVNEIAARILKEQMEETLLQIERYRQHVDAVAKALLAKNRLYHDDLEQILPPLPGRGSC